MHSEPIERVRQIIQEHYGGPWKSPAELDRKILNMLSEFNLMYRAALLRREIHLINTDGRRRIKPISSRPTVRQ